MSLSDSARELFSKVEVLKDLEQKVHDLMEAHERKRTLWFPSDLLGAEPEQDRLEWLRKLREQARDAYGVDGLTAGARPEFQVPDPNVGEEADE